jgi:tetratricopeptide (TPR) repeat protein
MTLFRHGLLLFPALLLVETAPSAAFEPSLSTSCKALWEVEAKIEADAQTQHGHRGQMIDCMVDGIEASHPSPAQIDEFILGWRQLLDTMKPLGGGPRPDVAIAINSVFIRLKPDDGLSYVVRGTAYLRTGEAEQAVSDFSTALRLLPASAENFELRSEAYESIGRLDLAIADLGEAIRLEPSKHMLFFYRANDYVAVDKPQLALADYESAIRLKPTFWRPYAARCVTFAMIGDASRAMADCDKALDVLPEDLEPLKYRIYNERCVARAILGDTAGAISDCDRALASHGDAQFLDSRGYAHLRAGDWAMAVADYDAALKQNPKKAVSLFGRGVAKAHLGKVEEGQADLAAARALQPRIDQDMRRLHVTP